MNSSPIPQRSEAPTSNGAAAGTTPARNSPSTAPSTVAQNQRASAHAHTSTPTTRHTQNPTPTAAHRRTPSSSSRHHHTSDTASQRSRTNSIKSFSSMSSMSSISGNKERKLHILNSSMRNQIRKLRTQLSSYVQKNDDLEARNRALNEENQQLRLSLKENHAKPQHQIQDEGHIPTPTAAHDDDDSLANDSDNTNNNTQASPSTQEISTQTHNHEDTKDKDQLDRAKISTALATLQSKHKTYKSDLQSLSSTMSQWKLQNQNFLTEMRLVIESIARHERMEMEKNYREASGYLIKRGAKVKSWKRRYFSFRRNLTFSYYPYAGSTKPINTVDVSSGIFEVYPDGTQKMDFVFKIVTQSRIFFVSASSTEELSRWINFLRLWRSVNTRKMDS